MKSTRLIVWLLVAACVAIDLAVIGELQVRQNEWPGAGGVIGLGLSFSQIVLLSLWLVWGRSGVLLRGVSTLLGVWGISCLANFSTDGGPHRVGIWFGVLLLFCGVCVIPLFIAKFVGCELSNEAAESPLARDRRWSTNQFTIWGLLSLMTTVGITLAVLRFAEFPMPHLFEVIWFVTILAATGCTILLLALFLRRLYIAILATLMISPIGGVLLSLFGPAPDDDALLLILMTFVQGAAILAAVVVLRTSGYRLVRSCPKQPVAEITA
ncbi:MAG: hypothetical protein WD070_12125 [Pirellulaceae bacterium]